jgi:hypothetical protein
MQVQLVYKKQLKASYGLHILYRTTHIKFWKIGLGSAKGQKIPRISKIVLPLNSKQFKPQRQMALKEFRYLEDRVTPHCYQAWLRQFKTNIIYLIKPQTLDTYVKTTKQVPWPYFNNDLGFWFFLLILIIYTLAKLIYSIPFEALNN